MPPTASRRRSAGLELPLGRYLVELEADSAEGRSWFGEPSAAELVDWEPVLARAGVHVAAHRVAAAYLELAVFVRALEGLSSTVRWQSTIDAGSLVGRPVRPAREPARPRPGRAPRHRCLGGRRGSPSSGRSTSTSSRGSSGCRGRARRSRQRRSSAFPGGKGANQAVAAARLGAEVTLVGAVGDDAAADEALANLREAGVELDLETAGSTGIALILVAADGENQIVVVPGANALVTPRDGRRAPCSASSRFPTRSCWPRPARRRSSP